MPEGNEQVVSVSEAYGEALTWSVWPARRAPWLAGFVIATIMGSSLVVHIVVGSAAYTSLTLVFLTLALAPFLFSTHYRLDGKGVQVSSLFIRRVRGWEAFRAYHADSDGVLLSPFSRPSALAATRGIYLRFGDDPERLLALVRSRLPSLNTDD